ncbi:hypothetical protein J3E68DRAFT_398544 [Trichoderma sp. SZMC 28012]
MQLYTPATSIVLPSLAVSVHFRLHVHTVSLSLQSWRAYCHPTNWECESNCDIAKCRLIRKYSRWF